MVLVPPAVGYLNCIYLLAELFNIVFKPAFCSCNYELYSASVMSTNFYCVQRTSVLRVSETFSHFVVTVLLAGE